MLDRPSQPGTRDGRSSRAAVRRGSPGKAGQQGLLALEDAIARCVDEHFVDGTRDHVTCLAFYATPGPGVPYAGQAVAFATNPHS